MDAIWRGPARVTAADDAIREPDAPAGSLVSDLEIIDEARIDPAACASLFAPSRSLDARAGSRARRF